MLTQPRLELGSGFVAEICVMDVECLSLESDQKKKKNCPNYVLHFVS